MDLYQKVRLACAEGMSQREAARYFNISRDSVAKKTGFSVPSGYRRSGPVKRPKLDGFTGIIGGWLDGDREVHRKQRHTAKRVSERLRDEHGFTARSPILACSSFTYSSSISGFLRPPRSNTPSSRARFH